MFMIMRTLDSQVKEQLKFIKSPTNNDDIYLNLELLENYVHRIPNEALKVIKTIATTKNPLEPTILNSNVFGHIDGRSHDDLISKCIELADKIRYLKPKEAFHLLINLSKNSNENLRSEATNVLGNLCKYNLFALNKIGYKTQLIILDAIEKWPNKKSIHNIDSLLKVTSELLEPSFEGVSKKDYRSINLIFGPLKVSNNLRRLRERTMSLLMKVFSLMDDLSYQIQILQVLRKASTTPIKGNYGADFEEMVQANTNKLIEYYIKILPVVENEIIKEIEEQISWFIRRFGKEHLSRIIELQSTIASKAEYEMFRVFVGYDSRFSDDIGWQEAEEIRKDSIQEFINDIQIENFNEWKNKILSVIKNYSSSQPGEFQYFSFFFNELGKQKPIIARKLLLECENELKPFLIHLVVGIWKSNSKKLAKELIIKWTDQNKHLDSCALIFEYVDEIDRKLLTNIFIQAKINKDVNSLNNILWSITNNYSRTKGIKTLLLNTIKELTVNNNVLWVSNILIRKGPILETLTERDYNVILNNLLIIPIINYQAEDILLPIAIKYPQKVISFFSKRVALQLQKNYEERYSAVPFSFYKLNKVLKDHENIVIPKILRWFNKKGWLYRLDASRLLQLILPKFNETLEKELFKLIKKSGEKNAKIVIAILNSYKGEPFLHNVCKEFIKQYSNSDRYKTEMILILSQEGVVTGEYGFVESYKRKKIQIQDWKNDKNKRNVPL